MNSVKFQLLTFVKGILAGLAIGLGGFLYILMCQYVPGELGKVLGSLLFAIGLFLVCAFGLSLYTGKIGYLKDKLILILVFNLIGIGITVAAYYIANPQFNELISAAASVKFEKT